MGLSEIKEIRVEKFGNLMQVRFEGNTINENLDIRTTVLEITDKLLTVPSHISSRLIRNGTPEVYRNIIGIGIPRARGIYVSMKTVDGRAYITKKIYNKVTSKENKVNREKELSTKDKVINNTGEVGLEVGGTSLTLM